MGARIKYSREMIIDMLKAGKTALEIKNELGCSYTPIQQAKVAMGQKLNPRLMNHSRKAFTDAFKREICDKFIELRTSHNVQQCAELLGVNANTITLWMHYFGYELPKNHKQIRRPLMEKVALAQRVVDLVASGLSRTQACQKVGIAYVSYQEWSKML